MMDLIEQCCFKWIACKASQGNIQNTLKRRTTFYWAFYSYLFSISAGFWSGKATAIAKGLLVPLLVPIAVYYLTICPRSRRLHVFSLLYFFVVDLLGSFYSFSSSFKRIVYGQAGRASTTNIFQLMRNSTWLLKHIRPSPPKDIFCKSPKNPT